MVSEPEYLAYKMDLDMGMETLKRESFNLYKALMGVLVYGNSIQKQANRDNVSKRQINRRLNDGIYTLTLIMNGGTLYDAS
jgi:hypothetical protein